MAQILTGPTASDVMASNIGSPIMQALQNITNMQLQNIAQQKERNQTIAGLSQFMPYETAKGIATLPPDLRDMVTKQMMQQGANLSFGRQIGLNVNGVQGAPVEQPETDEQPNIQPAMQQGPGLGSISVEQLAGMRPEQQLQILGMQQKAQQAQQKLNIQQQRESDKETLPVYEKINEEYKNLYVENNRRIGRMEKLIKEGKVDTAAFSSLLDAVEKGTFGAVNLDFLRSTDSQEFKKLSTEFLKDARYLFGSKITQGEIQLFMKMIPTLNQTDAGKMRVIRNMKIYNEAADLRKSAMDQIIKENKGIRPRDLNSLIEKRIGKRMEILGDKFKEGLQEEHVPLKQGLIKFYQDYIAL